MKTIRKIGTLLRQFTHSSPEHSLSDLARATGNSTSGTHDLVSGLVDIGMLQKIDRGRYRLGPLISSLHRVLEDNSALIRVSRPVLDALQDEYGETVHLTRHDKDRLLVLTAVEGKRNVRVTTSVLSPATALHDAPPGLLHLSTFLQHQRETYLEALPTVVRRAAREDLTRIQADGYFAGPIHHEDGVSCSAALIRNHANLPVGVISQSVPAERFDTQPRAFRNITLEAAHKISAALGRTGTVPFIRSNEH